MDAQFEIDMLTVIYMFNMPYEQAVVAARKEYKENLELEREWAAAEEQGVAG